MSRSAPSIKSIEIDLIDASGPSDDRRGSATWIARGLNIEEAQVMLKIDSAQVNVSTENQRLTISRKRDRLQARINGFLESSERFLGSAWDGTVLSQESDAAFDTFTSSHPTDAEAMALPLPSYF